MECIWPVCKCPSHQAETLRTIYLALKHSFLLLFVFASADWNPIIKNPKANLFPDHCSLSLPTVFQIERKSYRWKKYKSQTRLSSRMWSKFTYYHEHWVCETIHSFWELTRSFHQTVEKHNGALQSSIYLGKRVFISDWRSLRKLWRACLQYRCAWPSSQDIQRACWKDWFL